MGRAATEKGMKWRVTVYTRKLRALKDFSIAMAQGGTIKGGE